MSSIVFMPVCSRCGTVLYGKVIDCSRSGDPDSIVEAVSPDVCPVCHTYFNRIVIPTKLPWEAPEPTNNFGSSCFVVKELIDI